MVFSTKKIGAHLAPTARNALESCSRYPHVSVIANPLTREVARRMINAEWNALKLKLDFPFQAEAVEIAGAPCMRYRTENVARGAGRLLYIHGGAFVAGSARANASTILPACRLTGLEAVAVDYPLAPEHRFPKALEDIERVYRALIEDVSPHDIVVVGDSAGGNLAATSLLRWRDRGVPLPAGAVLLSPIVDGAGESDTVHTLRTVDPIVSTTSPELIKRLFGFYAGGADILHPEISPIHADLSGLPPLLVHVGAREILLGDAARLAEKARQDGVDVSLRVFDGMFHLFHMNWSLPQAKAAHEDIAAFIAARIS